MTDKITNILDTAKKDGNGSLPIELEAVLKNLQDIPLDIVEGYITGIEAQVEEFLLWKSVASAIKCPRALRHIVESLDEFQFERLQKISIYLLAKDPLDKLKEIREATFDIIEPTSESYTKALKIVAHVNSLSIDYVAKAKELAAISRQIKLLEDICTVANLGSEFLFLIVDKLATCSEEDLDALETISKSIKVSDLCKNHYNENLEKEVDNERE